MTHGSRHLEVRWLSLALGVTLLASSANGAAQVTARITANNGYAFGFGSEAAVDASTASVWEWNSVACDITCCTGWETYSISPSLLSDNTFAYILAAGDSDGLTSLTATFLDDMEEVVLNTTVAGDEWEACDLGVNPGSAEPGSGDWVAFVNAGIASCTWVGLVAAWEGGNSCSFSPTPEWVWGAGISTVSRFAIFRTRTSEITPPACVDTAGPGGVDDGCTSENPACTVDDSDLFVCVACIVDADCGDPTPLCDLGTNTCVACASASDCPDDGNECTAEVCTSGACDVEPIAAGTECATGVCTGGPDNACVPCLDDAEGMEVDSGCTSDTPTCIDGGTSAAECVACTTDGDCAMPTPFCDVSDGVCVECLTDEQCPDSAPVCATDSSTCTGCTSDADCEGRSDGPACGVDSGACGPAPEPDAGPPEVDAGVVEMDAGPEETDAGAPPRGAVSGGACGCRAVGASSGETGVVALMLLGLVAPLLGRRRR